MRAGRQGPLRDRLRRQGLLRRDGRHRPQERRQDRPPPGQRRARRQRPGAAGSRTAWRRRSSGTARTTSSKYVADPADCQVRVSLGLKPSFDGIYGWHPKDNTGAGAGPGRRAGRRLRACRAGIRPQIRLFDHKGNYVRTVFPPPADTRSPDLDGMHAGSCPTGRRVLRVGPYGCLLPDGRPGARRRRSAAPPGGCSSATAATADPRSTLFQISIATGGPVDGKMIGPPLDRQERSPDGGQHLAAQPRRQVDLHHRGLRPADSGDRRASTFHAVYRVPFDDGRPAAARLPSSARTPQTDADDKHLNRQPASPATRRAASTSPTAATGGSSCSRRRASSSRRSRCATLHVAVHHKTGEIYVLCIVASAASDWLRRVAKTINQARGPGRSDRQGQLSSWPAPRSRPPTDVGLFCPGLLGRPADDLGDAADRRHRSAGRPRRQVRAGRRLAARRSPRPARSPAMMYGGRMPKVVADPVRPLVCYHPDGWGNANPYRFNTETGKAEHIKLPSPADDIAFDAQGRLYCRAFKCLSRHDADKPDLPEIPVRLRRAGRGRLHYQLRRRPAAAGHARGQGLPGRLRRRRRRADRGAEQLLLLGCGHRPAQRQHGRAQDPRGSSAGPPTHTTRA